MKALEVSPKTSVSETLQPLDEVGVLTPPAIPQLPQLTMSATPASSSASFAGLTDLARKIAAIAPTQGSAVEAPPAPRPVVHRRPTRIFD